MRHGQTHLNKEGRINGFLDDTLSEAGKQQVASAHIPDSVTHIYSSPLQRTRETAEIVNEKLQKPISFHDELKEVNFGELNGAEFTPERRALHESMQYDWRPSGECLEDVKARVLSFARMLKETHDDGEVLIVSHGGIIRLFHLLQHGGTMGRVENASVHAFDLSKILAEAN